MTSESSGSSSRVSIDAMDDDSPSRTPGRVRGTVFNTFFLDKENHAVLKEIPSEGCDPSRCKRPHNKSRSGCRNCRKRRVKCDEKLPRCSHCSRRNEKCERRAYYDPNHLRSPTPDPKPPPVTDAGPSVNMLHMKLFHHFDTATRHTLSFGSVWKEAISWSIENESLMQAILSISARHLAYLCPDEPQYSLAATSHFAQALSLFRRDINQEFTASNADVFMATSVLIYYQLWTETECVVADSAGLVSLDLSRDGLFRLAGGLVEIFMSSGPFMWDQPSRFVAYVMHSPRQILNDASRLSKERLNSLQSFFSYSGPLRYEQLSIASAFRTNYAEDATESITSGMLEKDANFEASHRDVVSRLAVLLPFLPELRDLGFPEATELLMPELSRYAFTFLIHVHSYIDQAIRGDDLKGLLVLYHYFRAVRILFGGSNYWWTHKRARLMEALLKDRLQKECKRQSEIDSVVS